MAADDIMAFVKYEHQVFVVSLNPYDGHDQWIKVLSGLASPNPVDVVLMAGDKTGNRHDRSQGIEIVDRPSFLAAIKIVDEAKKRNEVLRVVLYPARVPEPVATTEVTVVPESSKKYIPLSRLCGSLQKSSSSEPGAAKSDTQLPPRDLSHVPILKSHSVFVQNLADDVEERDLEEFFERVGSVVRVKLTRDRRLAFCQFFEAPCVHLAVEHLDGVELHGSPISVKRAEGDGGSSSTRPPAWANEFKQELQEFIEDRFQELTDSLEDKLSQLGLQMKETLALSQTSSMTSSAVKRVASMSSSSTSSVAVISALELSRAPPKEALRPNSAASLESSYQASKSGKQSPIPSASAEFEQAPVMIVDDDASVSSKQSSFVVAETGGEDGHSETESVVLVSQPDSSFVEVENDNLTGDHSNDAEMVAVEAIQQRADDIVSESGSVVYVDTDGEDDDDEMEAYSNLRDWASAGALSVSQTTYTKAAGGEESMGSSFHSTVSDRAVTPLATIAPVEEEKSWPMEDSLVSTSEALTAESGNVDEVFGESGNVEEVFAGTAEASTSSGRPVPVNGSERLPINLNAMKSVDEQNLFSPNSDIGTMLLSAASSIANGFLQSMESLSKTLNEYEQRRMSQQHSTASSVAAPSETSQSDLQMDSVISEPTEITPILPAPEAVVEVASEALVEVPPPIPSRGPRGPPASSGPYLSWEQMEWYFAECGVPFLIQADWVNDRVTREMLNIKIAEYFDQQG
ncbi:hypothetical protein BV898_02184 [Hypsibius exemplaris]|uniref:RRM domain-containing protein n=1 Tax=Hypsibius exemplaris TaxID=2072580 RepID=A0A1W0X8W7_HYPEX|nr:hypothetical protein BV898_02184 [Hypsibius exemplaris]